jgi:hypothetical protein
MTNLIQLAATVVTFLVTNTTETHPITNWQQTPARFKSLVPAIEWRNEAQTWSPMEPVYDMTVRTVTTEVQQVKLLTFAWVGRTHEVKDVVTLSKTYETWRFKPAQPKWILAESRALSPSELMPGTLTNLIYAATSTFTNDLSICRTNDVQTNTNIITPNDLNVLKELIRRVKVEGKAINN